MQVRTIRSFGRCDNPGIVVRKQQKHRSYVANLTGIPDKPPAREGAQH
jgi:hypothetical protein